MVEVGSNMKIVQNDFKADDLHMKYSFPSIEVQVGDGNMDGPRTVNACVIEDNHIRTIWNTRKLVKVLDSKGKPKTTRSSWGEENKDMPPHTVVKVNKNAVGTRIGKWWTPQYPIGGSHKLFELVETASSFSVGHTHVKTHLHRDA
jgi:hypothetical protein